MNFVRAAALALAALVLSPPWALAQDAVSRNAGGEFTEEHLEEIVGPVALYPDALLAQILMASTYPIEIVEASRWMKDLKGISGESLDTALQGHAWDVSVKSLCNFPDVLERMSDNLDWTQDMGNAFLAQKQGVLDAVQRLRGKAKAAGNLQTSPQQTVTETESGIFAIQPSNPSSVSVPAYYPSAVYGLMYPAPLYPALYRPWPSTQPVYGYGRPVAAGPCLYGSCTWGRGASEVNVNVNQYNAYNHATNTAATNLSGSGAAAWNHDPAHRKGVNYSSPAVAAQYRRTGGGVPASQARGWGSGSEARQAGETRQTTAESRTGGGEGGGAFTGMGRAGFEQQASERGARSLGGGGFRGRR